MSQIEASASTTSEPSPAKRQRTDDVAESESESTRSNIWHDDGSVVLQVESTLFRVHWSVLSLHSTFFRDMRDLPQPADQPSIEGCPVIELHDSCKDVEHLLNALYNPHLFNEENLPFSFIAAIVRLGRKYDFKNLLAAAVQRLTYENPSTFESWEALTRIVNNQLGYSATKIHHSASIMFDMLSLARENNVFTVLPCAYLRAVIFYPQESILDGIPSGVGPPSTLSSHDQRLCILGREKGLKAQWDLSDFTAWISSDGPAPGCTTNRGCSTSKKTILQIVLQSGLSFAPFIMVAEQQLCSTCQRHHLQVMAEARKKLWQDLPSFFDLPPWAELKDDL